MLFQNDHTYVQSTKLKFFLHQSELKNSEINVLHKSHKTMKMI